ncbi:MAG: hypothetical protein ACPLVD_05330 [Dictyoglomus turgidum]|uniref:hypothetical protein n=1 Tax=Dictyoglomus turgidum TaxID=513050 RepID=UPI003C786F18
MRKVLIFLFLVSLTFTPIFSQDKFLGGWEKVYGGPKSEKGYGIVKVEDGYLLGGETTSLGSGGKDIYLLKIDKDGNKVFEKAIGGPKDDYSFSMIEGKDGYFIVGATRSFGAGNSDVYVVKVNGNGDILWQKTYGGRGFEEGWRIVKDNEGNYIIVGRTNSFGSGQYDLYLIKIDENGNLLWERAYGREMSEYGYGVCNDEDGYVAVGITNSFSEGQDIYVIKVDKNGNLLWEKIYGGKGYDYAYDITNGDDGYLIVGNSNSFSDSVDLYVLKTNKNGDKVWEKTYGGKGYDTGFSVLRTDTKYLIVGGSNSQGAGNSDLYVVKLDEKGNLIWEKYFGGADLDEGWGLVLENSWFIAIGRSESFSTANSELYVVKFKE